MFEGMGGFRASLLVAVLLCFGFSQHVAGEESPQEAAGAWAEAMVDQLKKEGVRRDSRLALALDPGEFEGLDDRKRRMLHDWLVDALRKESELIFKVTDATLFSELQRALEGGGKTDWFERYKEVVRKAEAQVYISCYGRPGDDAVVATCKAFDIGNDARSLASAEVLFRKEWIDPRTDWEWALGSLAGEIVEVMEASGHLKEVSIVEEGGVSGALSAEIEHILRVRVSEKQKTRPGSRPAGRDDGPDYRLKGRIIRHQDRYALNLTLKLPQGREVPFVAKFKPAEHLDGLAGQTPPSVGREGAGGAVGDACGSDEEIGRREVADGWLLADWVVVAEGRMQSGDYLGVLKEAVAYERDHCGWPPVAEVRDRALEGLVQDLAGRVEQDARGALSVLADVEALAGPHLGLLLLRAHAHGLLGERRQEERSYRDWLRAAPIDHVERNRVREAVIRVRDRIAIEDGERALSLDGLSRRLVRVGLSSQGHGAGSGLGAFDPAFRAGLRAWQDANGYAATGYLTREQAQVLLAEGREVEARAKDRAAFARAQAADASAAYLAYLKVHPAGEYAERARRLLAKAEAREEEELRRAAAEAVETALGLSADERVLVERGLAAAPGGGALDADGRFDAAFRSVLRLWQGSNDDDRTGYLTQDQADRLIRAGHDAAAREEENLVFVEARAADTAAAYRAYLAKYPNGPHAAEVTRRLEAVRAREDDASFGKARAADTAAAYEAYLTAYPAGHHAGEARRLAEEARAVERSSAVETALGLRPEDRVLAARGLGMPGGTGRFGAAVRERLRAWQETNGHTVTGYLTREQADRLIEDGRAVVEREKDDASFGKARAAGTAAAYEAYLAAYPAGHHAGEARRLAEEARAVERSSAVETALGLRPEDRVLAARGLGMPSGTGRFGAAVRERLRAWQETNGHTVTGYLTREQADRLIEDGRAVVEREKDDAAFGKARAAGTAAAYEAYLAAYPAGLHADEARRLAAEAQQTKASGSRAEEDSLGLSHSDSKLVQRALNAGGLKAGEVDGLFGSRTRKAIRAWQKANGHTVTGYLTREQADQLIEDGRLVVGGVRRHAGEAFWQPGHVFDDCDGTGWCPEMVVVPAGSFKMGSPASESEKGREDDEGPQHHVTISHRFAVGKYEVTRAEFARFVEVTNYRPGNSCHGYENGWRNRPGRDWSNPGFRQTERDPVVCVSWTDAQAYVQWLSRQTGYEYRLLTEAEWEYAARSRKPTSRYWGDDVSSQCDHANGSDISMALEYGIEASLPCDDGYAYTSPVGEFPANGFGLHDMLGNVWEWVEDCWRRDYRATPSDGRAWTSGGNCERRVLRGGSYHVKPKYLRSAERGKHGARSFHFGFRVARHLSRQGKP